MSDAGLSAERETVLRRDLMWEREEHDKARTEWLLMRDRLNGLREACENALSTTEPPGGYEEPWCKYDGEIEAAPHAWLAVLIAEALEKYEPFDHENWQEEEEKRLAERKELVAALDAERERRSRAEQQADMLSDALGRAIQLREAHQEWLSGARAARAGYRAGRDEAKL